MSQVRTIQTAFSGGELSPRMLGRVDTAIYGNGLELCENFVPTVEGPIVKRPGFEYIRAAAASATWLSSFRFSLTQDYLIEWSELRARFFTSAGRIETSPGVAYETVTPYLAADAPMLSTQQSFDRLYLDHASYPPAALTRTGAATFAHASLAFINGPFADANTDETRTVTASGTTGGGITLAASAPIFTAGRVGALFRVEAKDFSTIKAWEAGLDGVTVGQVRRSESKAYTALSGGRAGSVQPTHTQGAEWDGSGVGQDINAKPSSGSYGIQWEYRHDRFGIVRITAVAGDGLSATADVVRRLPDGATSVATFRWAHAAFSAAAGWPNIVKAFAGRLVHIKNFEVLASVAGDYLNHANFSNVGTVTADLAFRRTMATEDPALWAVGDRKLVIGTASRELAVGAINAAQAISGDNISAEPQSFYGSAAAWPVQIGTETIFVQRGGRKLRSARYDFGQDRYVAANRTAFARHITGSGVVQLAFQKEPEELLFAVREDGQAAVKPMSAEQDPNNLLGYGRVTVGGGARILSAATIASADGKTDELWALIQSDFGKWIGRMRAFRNDGDAIEGSFYVDAGVTSIAGVAQTHFTGLTHLAGKPVAVLADGGVVENITVAGDGSFDLPAAVVPNDRPYVVTVGLAFTARVVTLRPEIAVGGQTSQGRRQRLVRITLRLLETVGIRVGPKGGKLDQLVDRAAGDAMDRAVPLFTADSDRAVSGGWTKLGQQEFVSEVPLPATIIAAMPEVELG